MRHFLGVIITFSMIGCVSVPREKALELARAGEIATDGIVSQLQNVSDMTARQSEVQAFSTTYDVCSLTPHCSVVPVADELVKERQRLVKIFALRIKAVSKLNAAYSALKQEAEYDAAADLKTAVEQMTDAVEAYAGQLLPMGGTKVIGAVIPGLAEIFSRHRQCQRLAAANEVIGSATDLFRQALAAEKQVYEGFLESWTTRENSVRRTFLENGLTSLSNELAPLAQAIDAPLTKGSEQKISASEALRMATMAVAETRAQHRKAAVTVSFNAALSSLERLQKKHQRFGRFLSQNGD